jgi:membrane protease YdiL (CAAX protease family)
MMPQHTEAYYCDACNKEVKSYHRYCYNCGEYLGANGATINLFNNSNLQGAFVFFVIYLFVCLLVQFTGWFDNYNKLFWVEVFLALLTLFFTARNFNFIKPLLRFRNFNFIRVMGCISLALISSLIVNVFISRFNFSFFGTDTSYYELYSSYPMPVTLMIYSIAIYPSIIEELAFRGVLFSYLNTILDERLVIIVTGFMFGMMHLSFISLFWLVPFGILTGIMRRRFGTLWYGVIFHFAFNFMAVFYDLYMHGHL